MRVLSYLTAALLAASPSVQAQAQAQALDSAGCGAVEEQAMVLLHSNLRLEITQSATSVASATPQGCMVTDLDIHVADLGVFYRVDRLGYSGQGLLEWVRGEVILPASLELTLEGVARASGPPLPPELSWVEPLSAENITLSMAWDAATRGLQLAPVFVDLGDGNSVSLRLDGVASEWAPYDYSADLALSSLALEVSFNGLFEQAIEPPLASNGVDLSPASVAFFAAMANGLLAEAPHALIPPASQADIVAFLNALPNPRGELSLSMTNEAPFFPARVLHDLRTGVPFDVAVPPRLSLGASWAPDQ